MIKLNIMARVNCLKTAAGLKERKTERKRRRAIGVDSLYLAGQRWSLHGLYMSSGLVEKSQFESSTIPASFSTQTTSDI